METTYDKLIKLFQEEHTIIVHGSPNYLVGVTKILKDPSRAAVDETVVCLEVHFKGETSLNWFFTRKDLENAKFDYKTDQVVIGGDCQCRLSFHKPILKKEKLTINDLYEKIIMQELNPFPTERDRADAYECFDAAVERNTGIAAITTKIVNDDESVDAIPVSDWLVYDLMSFVCNALRRRLGATNGNIL